ncbi:MAG TPA: hypothetical protein VHG09_02840 [Longimicrobiales bacterium]|nr:hypothetical protein [Longimicrobiales bacterium]
MTGIQEKMGELLDGRLRGDAPHLSVFVHNKMIAVAPVMQATADDGSPIIPTSPFLH